MNSNVSRRFRCCLASLLLITLLLPMTTSAAQASEAGYAYHWQLVFDFESGINGQLLVDVGYNDQGAVQDPPLHSQSFTVACQRVGALGIGGGAVWFNGGYIKCGLDVKSAIIQTFAECAARYATCAMEIGDIERYRSLLMKAELASPVAVTAPIFAHPSASYAVKFLTVQAQMKSALHPIGTVDSLDTGLSLPTNVAQAYQAQWGCIPAGSCGMYYTIAGTTAYVDTADLALEFATPSSTILIGRDLGGSTIAAGSSLGYLLIDPGNGIPGN